MARVFFIVFEVTRISCPVSNSRLNQDLQCPYTQHTVLDLCSFVHIQTTRPITHLVYQAVLHVPYSFNYTQLLGFYFLELFTTELRRIQLVRLSNKGPEYRAEHNI